MPRAPKNTATAPTTRPKPTRRGTLAPPTVTDIEIARLAYELYEARGRTGGSPLDDWLHAEQQLLSRGAALNTDNHR